MTWHIASLKTSWHPTRLCFLKWKTKWIVHRPNLLGSKQHAEKMSPTALPRPAAPGSFKEKDCCCLIAQYTHVHRLPQRVKEGLTSIPSMQCRKVRETPWSCYGPPQSWQRNTYSKPLLTLFESGVGVTCTYFGWVRKEATAGHKHDWCWGSNLSSSLLWSDTLCKTVPTRVWRVGCHECDQMMHYSHTPKPDGWRSDNELIMAQPKALALCTVCWLLSLLTRKHKFMIMHHAITNI